jgi:hypothetical protein
MRVAFGCWGGRGRCRVSSPFALLRSGGDESNVNVEYNDNIMCLVSPFLRQGESRKESE